MTENDLILTDRIQKIQQIVNKYGIDNFYISFSGGKDSTILSEIVDMAFPGNNIPRVYSDTGIEYQLIREFVILKAETDKRFVIIKPKTPIKKMLDTLGYPFKSKMHSLYVQQYQRLGMKSKTVQRYLYPSEKRKMYGCPQKLRYQFEEGFNLKLSDRCCRELKKKPMHKWSRENEKPYCMLGIRASEGGNRNNIKCLVFHEDKHRLKNFNPLLVVSNEWEEWFIETYNVEICNIYKPPYNFTRTGCKGCPFNIHLQKDLDVLEQFFPGERKQCELIWKPVYDEYRRIGYRLDKVEPGTHQMNVSEYFDAAGNFKGFE